MGTSSGCSFANQMTKTMSLVYAFFILLCYTAELSSAQLFGVNEVVNCNENYQVEDSLNGTIQTLGYPEPYPENRHCEVKLKGHPKHRVRIEFEDFYLYHPYGQHHQKSSSCDGLDTLRIYDGLTEDSVVLGEYCGGVRPPPIMSSGPTMYLRLTSYSPGLDARGFLARYSFVTNFGITSGHQEDEGVCVFEYNYSTQKKKEGTIASPNPGGLYPRNTNCSYIFTGLFSQRIFLKFNNFDLEGIEPCTAKSGSDFLEFSSLPGFDACPARRCGRFAPQEVVSEGPHFRITFRSNDRLNGLGFTATYKFLTDDQLPDWAEYIRNSATGLRRGTSQITGLLQTFCCILLVNLTEVLRTKLIPTGSNAF